MNMKFAYLILSLLTLIFDLYVLYVPKLRMFVTPNRLDKAQSLEILLSNAEAMNSLL